MTAQYYNQVLGRVLQIIGQLGFCLERPGSSPYLFHRGQIEVTCIGAQGVHLKVQVEADERKLPYCHIPEGHQGKLWQFDLDQDGNHFSETTILNGRQEATPCRDLQDWLSSFKQCLDRLV